MARYKTPHELLDDAYGAISAAERVQEGDADPAHEDFYKFGSDLTAIPLALAEFTEVMLRQVNTYGQRYELRDDGGLDPQVRIIEAAEYLRAIIKPLAAASAAAAKYHSAIGHIGVTGKRGDQR